METIAGTAYFGNGRQILVHDELGLQGASKSFYPIHCLCSPRLAYCHINFVATRKVGDGSSDVRQMVCTSPRRSILNVVVAWHVLRCDSDLVVSIFRQQQCSGQASNTSSA